MVDLGEQRHRVRGVQRAALFGAGTLDTPGAGSSITSQECVSPSGSSTLRRCRWSTN
jgi:hypothetical protein